MANGFGRATAVAIAATLALGFGGGFLTAKIVQPKAGVSSEDGNFSWSLFGKPRDAKAARPAVVKPEGFAVWRTRMDTSGPEPLACIEMTRPLNPEAAYADFVTLQPDLGHPPAVTAKGAELCIGGGG
ncbi:MAG: hypothetical protein ABIO39_12680, partial [Caulobacteraceae bacterium]